MTMCYTLLTLLHSERPKLYTILAFLSAIGLSEPNGSHCHNQQMKDMFLCCIV